MHHDRKFRHTRFKFNKFNEFKYEVPISVRESILCHLGWHQRQSSLVSCCIILVLISILSSPQPPTRCDQHTTLSRLPSPQSLAAPHPDFFASLQTKNPNQCRTTPTPI